MYDLKFVKHIPAPMSKIALLKDKKGSYFLLKQRNTCGAFGQAMTVIEAFGAFVAEKAGIFCNKVSIISNVTEYKHKFYKHYPATLHTFVPGVLIKFIPYLKGLFFNQKCLVKGVQQTCGLRPLLLKNMTRHPYMPVVLALDTFIGNERNDKNLLYDQSANRFYVIDFGSSLRRPFAQDALMHLMALAYSGKSLSIAEKNALRVYKHTLQKLLNVHTLKSLEQKLDEFFKESGLLSHNSLCNSKLSITAYRKSLRTCLKQNYHATINVVKFLDSAFFK